MNAVTLTEEERVLLLALMNLIIIKLLNAECDYNKEIKSLYLKLGGTNSKVLDKLDSIT